MIRHCGYYVPSYTIKECSDEPVLAYTLTLLHAADGLLAKQSGSDLVCTIVGASQS